MMKQRKGLLGYSAMSHLLYGNLQSLCSASQQFIVASLIKMYPMVQNITQENKAMWTQKPTGSTSTPKCLPLVGDIIYPTQYVNYCIHLIHY